MPAAGDRMRAAVDHALNAMFTKARSSHH